MSYADVNGLSLYYDWTAETAAPTMLVFADADSVRPAHIVEFFGYDVFMSPLLGAAVSLFLDAPVLGPG
jgi:hypothetical protein